MPLQNRVDPFGRIHAVAARGRFTGNRGVIHDPGSRTLLSRRWTTKAWIICDCGYKGLKRDVMGANTPSGGAGWTNLFFLDEITALAAGHRPCFTCRRDAARDFLDCFGKAFGIARPTAPMIDERLHRERLASGGTPVALAADGIAALPDGAVISDGDAAYAVRQGEALKWSFAGYDPPRRAGSIDWRVPRLLTPATTVGVLGAGYGAVW